MSSLIEQTSCNINFIWWKCYTETALLQEKANFWGLSKSRKHNRIHLIFVEKQTCNNLRNVRSIFKIPWNAWAIRKNCICAHLETTFFLAFSLKRADFPVIINISEKNVVTSFWLYISIKSSHRTCSKKRCS